MRYTDATIDNVPKAIVEMLRKNSIKEKRQGEDEKEYEVITGMSKGLFLTGPTGIGKTYILHAINNRFSQLRIKSKVENWVELLLELRQRSSDGYLREAISQLCEGILMIDDIGAEKQTEWSQEMLYMIINRCYERNIPIFIATNLDPDQFQQAYGDRLYSRIVGDEMCEKVELSGEDKRFKK